MSFTNKSPGQVVHPASGRRTAARENAATPPQATSNLAVTQADTGLKEELKPAPADTLHAH